MTGSSSGSQRFVSCSLASGEINALAFGVKAADVGIAAVDALLLSNGDGLDVGVLDAAVPELHQRDVSVGINPICGSASEFCREHYADAAKE